MIWAPDAGVSGWFWHLTYADLVSLRRVGTDQPASVRPRRSERSAA